MKDQRVCRAHGGASPNALAAAERRRARAEAERAVAEFGDELDTDAHEALQKLINVSAGLVEYYRHQIIRYKPDALVWGDVEVRESDLQGLTIIQKERINPWLRLYNEERDHLLKLLSRAIDAGLAEREVRIAEEQGAAVAEVIRAVLHDLELTPAQQARALQVVPKHLRLASSDGESTSDERPAVDGRLPGA